jgi:hypothetical protein
LLLAGQVGAQGPDLDVGHLVDVGLKTHQRVTCGERIRQLGAGELPV